MVIVEKFISERYNLNVKESGKLKFALRLEEMSEEEINRLTENIKVANLAMGSAYLNDNIFDKLSDSDSSYWQYFDKTGDIQLGWWYKRQIVDKDVIMQAEDITEAEFYEREYEPGMVRNRRC